MLTSIGDSVKHVIMIGDHKQLRPTAECHDLSVERGLGYALNRSLFERLYSSMRASASTSLLYSTGWRPCCPP